jgi:hypothetical protein
VLKRVKARVQVGDAADSAALLLKGVQLWASFQSLQHQYVNIIKYTRMARMAPSICTAWLQLLCAHAAGL